MRRIWGALLGGVLLIATGCPEGGEAKKAVPNPGGDSIVHQGSKTKLRMGMTHVRKGCEAYIALEGTPPQSLDEVIASGQLNESDTIDPWGNQYRIEPLGSTVRVYSYGADGEEGGEEADRDWSSDELDPR